MNCDNAKEMLVDLLNNQLPETEKVKLEIHLAQCTGCKEELESLRQVWKSMGHLPVPEPGEEMRVEFYAMLKAYKNSVEAEQKYSWNDLLLGFKSLWTPRLVLRIAYSLCLFGFGLTAGYWFNKKDVPDHNYQQQISTLSSEVQEMRQMVLLSLIENPSATERLRAVSYSKDISGANDKVVEALLNTLNNDQNVNVRLVTIEALSELAANPKVREGLVQSLTKQESPIVQSAMVDVMVRLQEKRSVQQLKQLLKDENLNSLVKSKIEKSIQALS